MIIVESAKIRVVPVWGRPRSNYKPAYLFVSSRIYWKVANNNADKKPLSLSDFRATNSLELVRLDKGTWCDVDQVVMEDDCDGGKRITVQGRLHVHMQRGIPMFVRNVQIELIADTLQQHEVLLDRIQARIAPWKLLQQQMQDIANRAPSCGVEKFGKGVGALVPSNVAALPSSSSSGQVEGKWVDNLSKLAEKMEKLTVVDELLVHGAAGVETGATLAKLVASVRQVAETAEFVADVSKCVAGVSTVFHLVTLGAQCVSMCAEASRGRRVLPVALDRIVILLRYVLESLTEVIKPSQGVDEIDKDFVFNVLKRTVCTMDTAETQLLRGWGSQIVKAATVQEVDRKIEELEPLVLIARNTSRGCALGRKVRRLEREREVSSGGLYHVRPSTSVFFAGRSRELRILKCILDKWGSAVITQYGGVGKTALMTAFADRVEKEDLVPGGVFWMTVDGSEREVIELLAGLAEKLTRRRMSEEERRNPNLVITELKQALQQRPGRWLLCLDNADSNKVSGILNEVCTIARPRHANGWIVITSRQGQPRVCSRMKSEQELVLEPLCDEDAMVALWRQSRLVETSEQDDEGVMTEIKELEVEDRVEYCALKQLCEAEGGHGLGGLPLALVQAGSFIARFKCSFAKYLDLFNAASNKEDLQDIMKNTEELAPIRESQRSIWTTWRISVERLSRKAYVVLRAMAMLGEGGIGEAIVGGILKAATGDVWASVEGMFRNVVVEELVYGSSLVRCDEGGEGRVYRMHRLVRRFILDSMERGSDLWNTVHGLALGSVHEVVATELEKEDCWFDELPDVFGSNHRESIVHALALVDHYELPVRSSGNLFGSKIIDIHYYCGRVACFFDNLQKEVHVWECLLDIYQRLQEGNQKRWVVRLLGVCRSRNRQTELKRRIATVYFSLGAALRKIGSHKEAMFELERSLKMRRTIYGHDEVHPDIAHSLNKVAHVYYDQGNYEKAAELYEQSLAMYRAVHGAESMHSDIACLLCNLGDVYRVQGKLEKAIELLEHSLEMRRIIYGHGELHPDIAHSLNKVAHVYYDQGNYEKAAELYEQSLAMYRAVHGAESMHSDIACLLGNLGDVYRVQGKLEKAMELLEHSLEMRRTIYGHDEVHPDIASSFWCIGLVFLGQSKLNQAIELLEQSVEMLRNVHGRNSVHPDITGVLLDLADAYDEQGRREDALGIREQAAKLDETKDRETSSHSVGE